MTKEEQLELDLYNAYDGRKLKEVLDKFFNSNVCIPKGANRHPYADVFHEAMEDMNKIIQFEDGHAERDWTNLHLAQDRKHRIKPSEPIYEWQWNGILFDTPCTVYATEDEMVVNTFKSIQFKSFVKIEETKRVRQ